LPWDIYKAVLHDVAEKPRNEWDFKLQWDE